MPPWYLPNLAYKVFVALGAPLPSRPNNAALLGNGIKNQAAAFKTDASPVVGEPPWRQNRTLATYMTGPLDQPVYAICLVA